MALFIFVSITIVELFGAPHVIESFDGNTGIITLVLDHEPREIVDQLFNQQSTAMISVARRGALWIAGSEAIFSKPFFGIGKGNFKSFVKKTSSLSPEIKQSISIYSHAHNDLIQVTAEIGIVGLLSYLIFVTGCISIAAKKNTDLQSRRLVTISVMSFFYYGLAQSALVGSQNLTLTIAILAALGLATGRAPTKSPHSR